MEEVPFDRAQDRPASTELSTGFDRAQGRPFEEALKQLEAIVSRLELGDLPLEEALSIFEEGIRLTKLCSQRLNEAERRVNILVRSAESVPGSLEERPFKEEEDEEEP